MNIGQLTSLTYCDNYNCRASIKIHPHWQEVTCKSCGTVNNLVIEDFWRKRDNIEISELTESHCKWCSGDKVKTSKDSWDKDFLYIDSSGLHIEGETACGWENVDFSVDLQIKFCPNCGRKLS